MKKYWFKKFRISAKNIYLIVYDFDGVMTDNRVIVSEDGKESVVVNRSDGLAISKIKTMGIKQIIISTEKNSVVEARAKKINIDCIYGVENKKNTLKKYFSDNRIDKTKVVYVGNDVNDLEAMKLVGIKIATADAADDIKKIATYVTKKKGGEGVIRELMEIIK